jgi:hypothetical protein
MSDGSSTFLTVNECIEGRSMSNKLGLVVGLQSQRSICIIFLTIHPRGAKQKSVVKLRDRGAKQKIPLQILPYRGAKQNKTRGKKTHTIIIRRCPE